MRADALYKIMDGRSPSASFTIATSTDTRHHGQLDLTMLDWGVLIVRANGGDIGASYLSTDHIVAVVPG